MSLLTPEELEKLSGAEELFPSPIPVQFVSSDEFMPSPQSPQQKEFEVRVKDIGARLAKKVYAKSAQHGGDRSNLAYGYINKA